jgi:hypothetical protein
MSVKNKKLIDLYKEWMEKGDIFNGLCGRLDSGDYQETFELFVPTKKEKAQLEETGFCEVYWASGLPKNDKKEESSFTPLRQTIVLLICAMHNEL